MRLALLAAAALCCQSQPFLDRVIAPPAVLLLQGPPIATTPVQWADAVRLRNDGSMVFIAQPTVLFAVVNNMNMYRFQGPNLFYWDAAIGAALFLTYLVPGHRPLGVAWQHVHPAADGVESDGDSVLVHTATCVLRLWIKAPDFMENPRMSIVAGHCYEAATARDGLATFARFNRIDRVATSCEQQASLCRTLILDTGLRLAVLQDGRVFSTSQSNRTVQAISLGAGSTLAIAWGGGGFSVSTVRGLLQTGSAALRVVWAPETRWLALSALDTSHVFALGEQGQMVRFDVAGSLSVPLGRLPWAPTPGFATRVALDLPYGLFVLDGARASFFLAPNLGCVCPPGYAVAQIESSHCQPAPAGGYVTVLGQFMPCPAGTFGSQDLATAQQTCARCPPQTVSNLTQSTRCTVCLPGTLPDPTATACVEACPAGTQPMLASGCRPCPIRGQYFDAVTGACARCPEGMFTDPAQGQYTCMPCPGPSPPCPVPACVPGRPAEVAVVTISMLGIRAMDMAVARGNGTIFIAAFQTLITIGHSGNAVEVYLPEFGLVRGIALSPDEGLLYAAVTQGALLCIAYADTPRLLQRWYWTWGSSSSSSAALVGVRLLSNTRLLVLWDAASNSLRAVDTALVAPVPFVLVRPALPIVAIAVPPNASEVWVMTRDRVTGMQTIMTHEGRIVLVSQPAQPAWNPYMAFWHGELVLSSQNMLLWRGQRLGAANLTGMVDSDSALDARFTGPGPMAEAPNSDMLLVLDQIALRLVHYRDEGLRMGCLCPEGSFIKMQEKEEEAQCWPCPIGWISMYGAQTCTSCMQSRFTNPRDGACVPCPRIRWWQEALPCTPIIDTMVRADASGLTLSDMVSELATGRPPPLCMQAMDYVSLQTLVLPIATDAVLLDAAANARFWTRAMRVTPPIEVYVLGQLLELDIELTLPGFWVACSEYVLEIETCTCNIPAGGVLLGNRDLGSLWNKARADAAAIDYGTLLITPPPDPDLYTTEESFHFRTSFNISNSGLFVSRTDAGGGTDDDNPNVILIESVDVATSIALAPLPMSTPSQSAFATCVAGWPATYACPAGFLWVAALFTCVPCKPGFVFLASSGRCAPCPIGTVSTLPASTACSLCPGARATAQSACNSSTANASQAGPDAASCRAGEEMRALIHLGAPQQASCLPCMPGYSKPAAGSQLCLPCAPGLYANGLGRTACTQCPAPLVAAQWGMSACTPCPAGAVPSPQADACRLCPARTQYFSTSQRNLPMCVNKTVLQCATGYYLEDGGMSSDNRCLPCLPCAQGTLMVPFQAAPCTYSGGSTVALGPQYRCVPLRAIAGQFSRLSVNVLNSSVFDVQYTPCQGLPPFAAWAEGPSPSFCFFQCNYAVLGPVRRQYLFYYSMERQDAPTQAALQQLPLLGPNIYPLDYPGLAVDLMQLAGAVCLPCPNTPCPMGKWRPLAQESCGPPTCSAESCQSVEAGPLLRYDNDGCVMNCTLPANAHLTGLAPVGAGDACPWECNVGFYMEPVMLDLDENRTGYACFPCSIDACRPGLEEYHMAQCLPTSVRADFCTQCPTSDLVQPVPGAVIGTCAYACIPNISYQSSFDHQCKPCMPGVCPAGFRRVCAEQPCVACPSLPKTLWASGMVMPSSTDQCQVACRDGFHTLSSQTREVLSPSAFSYDYGTILCASCIQRPTIPCPGRLCPAGYFMPVPGSGQCSPCPTDYDCGLGLFPSNCICTQCPRPLPGQLPILAAEADMLLALYGYSVPIRCPVVCAWNWMPLLPTSACVPCSTLNTPALSFYAVWNASNGTRWWRPDQDPPHLPLRPAAGGPERRAGLCWPCPPGTLTLPNDADLCLSSSLTTVSSQLQASSQGEEGLVFFNPLLRQQVVVRPLRKLLSLPAQQGSPAAAVCPHFASGPSCTCNPGFVWSDAAHACVFEQRCSQSHRLVLAPHKDTTSLRLIKHPDPCHHLGGARNMHVQCGTPYSRSTNRAARHELVPLHACGPGMYFASASGMCHPCAPGSYSTHHGLRLCLPCPRGMTTLDTGSVLRAQCVIPMTADLPFALPRFPHNTRFRSSHFSS